MSNYILPVLAVVIAALVLLWVRCACVLNGRLSRREEAEELRREMQEVKRE